MPGSRSAAWRVTAGTTAGSVCRTRRRTDPTPSTGSTATCGCDLASRSNADVCAASGAQLTAVTATAAPSCDGPATAATTRPASTGGAAFAISIGPVAACERHPTASPISRHRTSTTIPVPTVVSAP